MAKPSHREKILTQGLRVVHERGFAGASVRDIVLAAGVPQGSFTNHFASKEAFGLEVIDRYLADSEGLFEETLGNKALSPLRRLRDYLDAGTKRRSCEDMRNGCLFGNFAAEASAHSEAMRLRLMEIFAGAQRSIAACLEDAVEAGELPPDFDCEKVAGVIVSSLQGANLLAKTLRSPAPVEHFVEILFSTILR